MRLIKNIKFKVFVLLFLISMIGITIYSNTFAKYITYVVEPIFSEEPTYENIVLDSEYNAKIHVNSVEGIDFIEGSFYTLYNVTIIDNYKGDLPGVATVYVHGARAEGTQVIDYFENKEQNIPVVNKKVLEKKIFEVKSRSDEMLREGKEYNVALNELEEGKYIVPSFGYGIENDSFVDRFKEFKEKAHFL